jgi:hypothetical protein
MGVVPKPGPKAAPVTLYHVVRTANALMLL